MVNRGLGVSGLMLRAFTVSIFGGAIGNLMDDGGVYGLSNCNL